MLFAVVPTVGRPTGSDLCAPGFVFAEQATFCQLSIDQLFQVRVGVPIATCLENLLFVHVNLE